MQHRASRADRILRSAEPTPSESPPGALRVSAGLAAVAALLAAVAAFASPAPAQAVENPAIFDFEAEEYRLRPGDTLELRVVRLPQLTSEAVVGMDGQISFPLVGVIDAAGLDLNEVRETVRGILGNKVLDGFDPAQPNAMILLDPEEVDIRVSAYRPVFIDGDVENRGAIAFRPGMTVRQAVVEAGGYAVDRYLLEDNGVTEAALRARYQELWIDYTAQSWRIWSLRQELGEVEAAQPETAGWPVDEAAATLIAQSESARLVQRERAFDALLQALESRKAAADERLSLLEQQLAEEQKQVDFDKAELTRAEGLLARGTGTRTRVADIRRDMILSSSRFLQVQGQLADFASEAQAAAQEVATARADRSVNLLDELTENQADHAQTRAEIESMAQRLKRKTVARAARPLGGTSTTLSGEVAVTVFRADSGEMLDGAPATTILRPGDVVEIRLPALPI